MAEHTIYTKTVLEDDGSTLHVKCACERFEGRFDDNDLGRALATAAKNQHRLSVGAPPVLPDGVPDATGVEFDVEYEYGGQWLTDMPAFRDLEKAAAYRDVRVAHKAHNGARMRVSRVTTTTVREPVA